jgi:pyridoxal 5'-phosphate synthase pdxS subunit
MKERATPLDVEHNHEERAEAISRAKAVVIATVHYKRSEGSDRCR